MRKTGGVAGDEKSDLEVNRYKQQYIESTRGDQMKKITVRLFVRSEDETEYRNWDDLTDGEKNYISECLIREAAHSSGFKEQT